jgi:hypothetical protein
MSALTLPATWLLRPVSLIWNLKSLFSIDLSLDFMIDWRFVKDRCIHKVTFIINSERQVYCPTKNASRQKFLQKLIMNKMHSIHRARFCVRVDFVTNYRQKSFRV